MRKLLDENPQIDIIDFWPNDGLGWCECEACRALEPEEHNAPIWAEYPSRSHTYLKFMNKIAEEIHKSHPRVLLGGIAYSATAGYPQGMKPYHNTVFSFAPFHRCMSHPLNDSQCPRNSTYFKALSDWAKEWKEKVYLYAYYMSSGSQWHDLPYPVLSEMIEEWANYKKVGVIGATLQAGLSHWPVYGLNYYLFAKLGWQDNIDRDGFLDDYCRRYFREAAFPIKEYHLLLERAREKAEGCIMPNYGYLTTLLDEGTLQECERCINSAEKTARSDRVRRRVARLKIYFQYTKLVWELVKLRNEAADAKERGKTEEAGAKSRKAVEKIDQIDSLPPDEGISTVWLKQTRNELEKGQKNYS